MRFWSLHFNQGPVPYERAHKLQLELVEQRAEDLIPDTILFLEHEPVITRGRGLQFHPDDPSRPRRIPIPGPIPTGVSVRDIERGGDLTFHEPGQLVVYPICRLGDPEGFAPERDIGRFLRRFEDIVIATLRDFGVNAGAREHATGVWAARNDACVADSGLEGDSLPRERTAKVASMGIAVRRWVTYHGIAINVVNPMDGFRLISPCGYSPETMARLADLAPSAELFRGQGNGWRSKLELAIATKMGGPEAELSQVEFALSDFESGPAQRTALVL